jgi:hypothetical protein
MEEELYSPTGFAFPAEELSSIDTYYPRNGDFSFEVRAGVSLAIWKCQNIVQ